jgi:hypothetical protein
VTFQSNSVRVGTECFENFGIYASIVGVIIGIAVAAGFVFDHTPALDNRLLNIKIFVRCCLHRE